MQRWGVVCGVILLATAPGAGEAQDPPRVVRTGDIASVIPQLRRKISLKLEGASVDAALQAVAQKAALAITYNDAILPRTQKVWLSAESIRTDRALEEILRDSGLRLLALSTGQVVVVRDHEALSDGVRPIGASTVSGRVTASKTGAPIVGASVMLALADSALHAVTADSGQFTFTDVPLGEHAVTARHIGSRPLTKKVVVTDQPARIDFALEDLAVPLDELVSTATGQQRRRDIANDVTVINADSVMQTAPIRSVTDLLETRVPGLMVQHTSGAPGDPSRLRLRGVSSPLRSNDPIVIVDGVRVYAEQSATRSGNLAANQRSAGDNALSEATGVNAAPSPLDYIDPNSIETIEVLKGPSAATLYGQDAANGVIVITTKKGRAGPTRWTASVEQGRTRIEGKYPELLYRWGHDIYDGVPVNCRVANDYDVGGTCIGDSIIPFQLLNDPALTVLDRGHRTRLSLGASGGSSALTYALTGSYGDEVGLIKLPAYEADRYQSLLGLAPPDWMRRPQRLTQWGVTTRIGAQLGPKADVSLTASLSRTDQQKSTLQDQLGNLMGTYLDRSSGTYYRLSGDRVGTEAVLNALDDYYRRVTADATQFTNGINATWRPRQWLTFSADAGLNLVQRADGQFFPRGPANDLGLASTIADTTGYVNDGQGRSLVSTVNLRANALAPLGRGFQFRFAAGANYQKTSTNDIGVGSYNLAPGSSLQGMTTLFMRRAESTDATFGWYAEPSIGNNKLNFSSGLRLDGGSSYGSNVSGLKLPKFPKLGFSYLLSDESWFPFKDLVQSFRVRLSYGRASRQPSPEDRLRLYEVPGLVYADGDFHTGVTLEELGNTEVRPERSTEVEGGFDADLFDSRLTLSVTGYRKTTDDALLNVPVASSVYGDGVSIIKNIGVTRNTGLEMTVGAQLIRNGPVTWTTNLQLSQNRNVLVKLAPGVEPFYTDGHLNATDGGIRVAPGYPLFGRWSRPILGYADANGNRVLEREEIQLSDTATFVGSTYPNYIVTLNTTVSFWRGAVTVDAGLQYQDGLAQRNEVAQRLGVFSAGQQDPAASLDAQMATANFEGVTDYNWIQVLSTTRLTSLAVNYRVPAPIVRALHAQQLNVAVQGSNLGLWTNYRGLDPNVNAFGTGNNVTDTGILPQPRTWQLRVQAIY